MVKVVVSEVVIGADMVVVVVLTISRAWITNDILEKIPHEYEIYHTFV